MTRKINTKELLRDAKVRKEIERYKWIESEKHGADIGEERACREWLSLHAASWQKQHPSIKRSKPAITSKAK